MVHEAGFPSRRSVGLITADPTPTLLSLLAHTNVDFVVLDAEQTGVTVQQCVDVVQRLAGSGVRVAVRVPDLAPNTLVAFANTGVAEIVLPQVRTVEELERAYDATRYPPEGSRPRQVNPSSAFGRDYSFSPDLTVLFETVEAVEQVKEIANSRAFSGGWVGPTDLGADLARHDDLRPEALEKAIQRVVDVLLESGSSIGLPAKGLTSAGDVFARGADRCAVYWERELAAMLAGFVRAKAS